MLSCENYLHADGFFCGLVTHQNNFTLRKRVPVFRGVGDDFKGHHFLLRLERSDCSVSKWCILIKSTIQMLYDG